MSSGKTALITGASGGIGEQLCREFARHGYDVIITARDGEKLGDVAIRLRETYGVKVKTIVADLNQEDSAKVIYHKVRDAGLQVDVLVNNAGFGLGGYFFQNRPRTQDAMIRVNMLSPTRLCRMFLPGMVARGSGKILNVASTGGFVAGPMNAVYCASKAYVLSLTEALAEELSATNITVTALCPGGTHTGFAHRADMETTRLFNYCVMDAWDVAHIGYIGMMMGKRVVVPGLCNKLMIAGIRLLPRSVAVCLSKAIQRPYTTM